MTPFAHRLICFAFLDVMNMKQTLTNQTKKLTWLTTVRNLHFLKIAVLAGLILILNLSAVRAESPHSSPQLTCSVSGQEQKKPAVVSNLGLIHLDVKLEKFEEQSFQSLWIPSNKKDWVSQMYGVDKKVGKSKKKPQGSPDRKQTVFIQVVSASGKEKIPFTIVNQGGELRFNQDRLSLLLEIPLDAQSKKAKVDELYKLMDQKRTTASGGKPELSAKERHDRFKSKKLLMNSMLEHRVGKFLISCIYIADRDKFWKGKLAADPLIIEVKNDGSFWDRRIAGNKKVVVGGSPSKPKPRIVLNALGKEMEHWPIEFLIRQERLICRGLSKG